MNSAFVRPEIGLQLFRGVLDGMVITDANGTVSDVNPAYEHMTGYSREEWIGQRLSMFCSEHTPAEFIAEMRDALNSRGNWRGDVTNYRKDGSEWISSLNITRITSANGDVLAYVGIARDVTDQRRREKQLAELAAELDLTQDAAFFALVALAESRAPSVFGQAKRIRGFTALLLDAWEELTGCGLDAREDIIRVSVLHDIGKVAIPDGILLKPGRLTPEEFAVIKSHTAIGFRILDQAGSQLQARLGKANTLLSLGAKVARSHHEWWDGSGYPDGLAGAAIPFAARVVAIADVYDALISRRAYKLPWRHDQALDYIAERSGRQFDPNLVQAFLQAEERFRRLHIELSDVNERSAPQLKTPTEKTEEP